MLKWQEKETVTPTWSGEYNRVIREIQYVEDELEVERAILYRMKDVLPCDPK